MATAVKTLQRVRSPYLAQYAQNLKRGRVTSTPMFLGLDISVNGSLVPVLIYSELYHVGRLSYRCDTLCAMGVKAMPPVVSVVLPEHVRKAIGAR